MECPHLPHCVTFDLETNLEKLTGIKDLQCAGCGTQESRWLCLACAQVNCGRYIQAHAKQHWELQGGDHSVCMDCSNTSVFCYVCDDYVTNDTTEGLIQRLRDVVQQTSEKLTNGGGEEDDDSYSCVSSQSGASLAMAEVGDDENGLTGSPRRSLRTRKHKRSLSADSLNNENKRQRGGVDGVQDGSSETTPEDRTPSDTPPSESPGRPRDKKVVGLRNLGNTCFMNAVLQSLSNIQEFCCYFKKLPSLEGVRGSNGRRISYRTMRFDESEALMTEELRKVLISLDNADKVAISPESLFSVIWKVVPRFRGYQQQDAHEFLRYMLDRLHTELLTLLPDAHSSLSDGPYSLSPAGLRTRSGSPPSTSNSNSIVTSVFGGTLQSEVRCLNCGVESKKHDPFLDLSLDVPERFLARNKSKENEETPNKPVCNLEDCLTSFVEVEELADTELYYCNTCKSKQRSTKRFWIRRLPNVLCLHIKRFRWSYCSRTKLDTYISFPVNSLDMSQFLLSSVCDQRETRQGNPAGSNLYDLAAVIVHHGSGAGSGHYTAFAINDGQWFHFNDSTVRPIDLGEVERCKAYILFYIRREFRLPQFGCS